MKNSIISRSVITLLTIMVISGCTTINPYTGQQQTSKLVKYSAIGGVACALIGATESSTRARNAGVGCAAIGAGVGAYMDAQEAELGQVLAGSGVQVRRDGDNIELIMPGNITFNTNEFAIKPQFFQVLDSVSTVLYKFKDTRVQVTGHTDSTGSADYNYGLSNRRATSVTNYLAGAGVDQNRLLTQGMGADSPIASNATESGRAQNRRVELHIVPQVN